MLIEINGSLRILIITLNILFRFKNQYVQDKNLCVDSFIRLWAIDQFFYVLLIQLSEIDGSYSSRTEPCIDSMDVKDPWNQYRDVVENSKKKIRIGRDKLELPELADYLKSLAIDLR